MKFNFRKSISLTVLCFMTFIPVEGLYGLQVEGLYSSRVLVDNESDSESVEEEPPQNEADSLQRELETMTARLKASSLAVHEKLREQSKKMEQLDDATSQNQNAVSKERTALDQRSAARTRTLLQALAALVAVVASFFGTYVFIAVFPKHR